MTDNGSNFVKAFRVFGATEEESDDQNNGVEFLDVDDAFSRRGR